ncbi:unnamed protein product [Heterosigma akashiwo]
MARVYHIVEACPEARAHMLFEAMDRNADGRVTPEGMARAFSGYLTAISHVIPELVCETVTADGGNDGDACATESWALVKEIMEEVRADIPSAVAQVFRDVGADPDASSGARHRRQGDHHRGLGEGLAPAPGPARHRQHAQHEPPRALGGRAARGAHPGGGARGRGGGGRFFFLRRRLFVGRRRRRWQKRQSSVAPLGGQLTGGEAPQPITSASICWYYCDSEITRGN